MYEHNPEAGCLKKYGRPCGNRCGQAPNAGRGTPAWLGLLYNKIPFFADDLQIPLDDHRVLAGENLRQQIPICPPGQAVLAGYATVRTSDFPGRAWGNGHCLAPPVQRWSIRVTSCGQVSQHCTARPHWRRAIQVRKQRPRRASCVRRWPNWWTPEFPPQDNLVSPQGAEPLIAEGLCERGCPAWELSILAGSGRPKADMTRFRSRPA
jgi:hypothetical protein